MVSIVGSEELKIKDLSCRFKNIQVQADVTAQLYRNFLRKDYTFNHEIFCRLL